MGVGIESLSITDCNEREGGVAGIIDDDGDLDESLSSLEAQWLIAVGAAQLPVVQEAS